MSSERDAAARPLVYVAGPITAEPWACVRKAIAASNTLDALGMAAYLPQLSVLHEMVEPRPYEHWVEHGLAMVERCDGLLRIPGESGGADREVDHALGLRIPVWLPGAGASVQAFEDWCELVRARCERRRPSTPGGF